MEEKGKEKYFGGTVDRGSRKDLVLALLKGSFQVERRRQLEHSQNYWRQWEGIAQDQAKNLKTVA